VADLGVLISILILVIILVFNSYSNHDFASAVRRHHLRLYSMQVSRCNSCQSAYGCVYLQLLFVRSENVYNLHSKFLSTNNPSTVGYIKRDMPKILLFTHIPYIGITLVHCIQLHEFAVNGRQLGSAAEHTLHRNRRAACLIPAREGLTVNAGVPQATKLGPILLLVMVNDLKNIRVRPLEVCRSWAYGPNLVGGGAVLVCPTAGSLGGLCLRVV
jgi:hypothetical protein